MIRLPLVAALLLSLPTLASAHEIWVEREGQGPARIYLGEPAQPLPPGGDPEFAKLKAPQILPAPTGPQARRAGYIEVALPAGDVRVMDDNVFAPWGPEGARESVVYYARAGRTETQAGLPLEFAPDRPGSNRLLLLRNGKPQPGVEVTLIDPARAEVKLKTDAAGAVFVPVKAPGRYLLAATLKDEGRFETPAGPVATLYHTSTISFTNP